MGPAIPAARGLGPLPLLLPLLLLLLRAQLAVGSLAGGSPSAAEVRPGRVQGDGGRGGTGPLDPDADRSRAESAVFPARLPGPPAPLTALGIQKTVSPGPISFIICRPSPLQPPA